jgi:predicted ATP-grasp superfamily ATP-dependent carboligase
MAVAPGPQPVNSSDAVLIVAADTVPGLTAIRSIGRQGVRVHAAYRAGGLGTFSRYCQGAFQLPTGDKQALEELKGYSRLHGISHIMGIEERDIPFLNWCRSELEPDITVLCAPQAAFALALHKDRTLALAARLGIPVPRTVYPKSAEDIDACSRLRFPVVIKPKHRDTSSGWQPVFDLKSETLGDFGALARKLEEYRRRGELPLVQEFAPGYGVAVSVLMHRQAVQQIFQHRRLRERPPLGGESVFSESVPLDPALAGQSVALLRAMNWEGPAMVEYRFDPGTGSALLMEVNGRFWGSLPLADYAGADFPYLYYRSLTREFSPTPYRIGVKARDLSGDTRWLLNALRSGNGSRLAALGAYLRAFGPNVRYYIWSLSDPLPAIQLFVLGCLRILPSSLRTPGLRMPEFQAFLRRSFHSNES